MKHRILLPFIACLCIGLSSCVYFNVFYNAEKYYREARETQVQRLKNAQTDTVKRVIDTEEKLYDKSIEKCSKILELYPNKKKYVSRATLMIGEIYFYEGKYEMAIRKCNEFITNYPGSQDYYEALYFKAMSYFEQSDLDKAESEFNKIIDGEKTGGDYNRKAQFMLAEISVRRGSSFGAIDQLKKLKGGGRIFNSLINFKMGNLLFTQKNYKEAYGFFVKVENIKADNSVSEVNVPENIKYKAQIMAGRCLLESNDLKKAIGNFEDMLNNDAYYKFFGEIDNYIALCLWRSGRTEEARTMYLKVLAEYPKSRVSATACYNLGLLYEGSFGDITQAFKYFSMAKTEFGDCEEAKLAAERYKALRSIVFLRSDLDSLLANDTTLTKNDSASIDSLKKLSPAQKFLDIAEIYLFSLSNGDSAVQSFKKIMELDTTGDTLGVLRKQRMQASYAVAWIDKNILHKDAVADSLFSAIIAQYPATEYAKAAQAALGQTVTIMTRQDSVAHAYMRAESLYTPGGDYKAAIESFVQFAEQYPDTAYAAKALFASAWLYENTLFDNATAEITYKVLYDKFPQTEYGKFARRKLEGKKEEVKDVFLEKPGEGAEGTVLDRKMADKIQQLASTSKTETTTEDAWVKLTACEAEDGKMEGDLRSKKVLMDEITPAMSALDELYIDMIDEDLTEEGNLTARIWIAKTGEVTKVVVDKKSSIKDKSLITEAENILKGMEFADGAPQTVILRLELSFTNKAKDTKKDIDEE